jgi:hypothetical protein
MNNRKLTAIVALIFCIYPEATQYVFDEIGRAKPQKIF